jgi:hypothetical protein
LEKVSSCEFSVFSKRPRGGELTLRLVGAEFSAWTVGWNFEITRWQIQPANAQHHENPVMGGPKRLFYAFLFGCLFSTRPSHRSSRFSRQVAMSEDAAAEP